MVKDKANEGVFFLSGNINSERLLARVLFSAVMLFVSLQFFSSYPDTLSEDSRRLAGSGETDWASGSQVVTFYLVDYSLMPYIRVLVNGEVKGAFDKRYVTVAVREGDSIAIDGVFYARPVSIEVLDVSSGVKNPRKGSVYRINGNIISLGEVKI